MFLKYLDAEMYKVRTIKAQEDYAMDGKLSRLKCRVYTQVR